MRNCGEYEERDKMEKKDHPPKAKAFRRAGKDQKEKGKTQKDQRGEGNTGEGKVSVIVTVKNDPEGERKLMEALGGQTVRPDEVVVVRAEEYGNCSRGRGRNIGVGAARNEVIAVTDAGCRPRKDWIEKLVRCLETDKSYKDYKNYKKNDDDSIKTRLPRPAYGGARNDGMAIVVAGWYRAVAKTELQRVMAGFLTPIAKIAKISENREREINRDPAFGYKSLAFLPASRSIMFTKKAWEAVGGYPEAAVSGGEDLEFARRLARHPGVKMIYCPQAVVDWEGPARLGEFFRDIVKHTRGNVEVGYWPHLIKNFTVVLRWMVFAFFPWMIPIYLAVSWLYKGQAFSIWFPIVQLAADFGVIWGLTLGILGRLGRLGEYGEKEKKEQKDKKERNNLII